LLIGEVYYFEGCGDIENLKTLKHLKNNLGTV
jgi:hypothetical protein